MERNSERINFPSESYPWLVYFYGKNMKNQLFCSLDRPHRIYRKSIPELYGFYFPNIVAYCTGWFLLNRRNTHFSLWNPRKPNSIIRLPPLSLIKPTQVIKTYALSSPPGDPNCMVILYLHYPGSIIFIRPEDASKQWVTVPYGKFLAKMDDIEPLSILFNVVSCNGKLYSLIIPSLQLVTIHVDKDNNVSIERLLPCQRPKQRETFIEKYVDWLVECCGELCYVFIGLGGIRMTKVIEVQVFKLDFESMVWERQENLMGHAIFGMGAQFFSAAVGNGNGNGNGIEGDYVYFTLSYDDYFYAYNLKDRCLSVNLPCSPPRTCSAPIILFPDHVCSDHTQKDYKDEKSEEIDEEEDSTEEIQIEKSRFPDLPLDSFWEIANWLNLYDYLNFRAVCCSSRLTVPKLRKRQALQKLKSSPSSPWMLLPTNNGSAFKFVDPVRGTTFFKNLPESLEGTTVRYSKNGWLIMDDGNYSMSFLNPFTEEIIKLPTQPRNFGGSFGMAFSSLPTSPDTVVLDCSASFTTIDSEIEVLIATVGSREWQAFHIGLNSEFLLNNNSPVFYNESFYLLGQEGNLSVLNYDQNEAGFDIRWGVLEQPRKPCRYFEHNFLVESDGKLTSIFVGPMQKWVKIFNLNFSTMRWERVISLGNHVIYVSRSSCIFTEARIEGTENRIYFPRFRGKSILYYCLKTGRFRLDGEDTVNGFCNTKEPLWGSWIDPVY